MLKLVFALGLIAGSTFVTSSSQKDDLTVKTSSGTLHGFVNSTAPQTRQFLGIQYAAPPVGELRFRPPVKHFSKKIVNATKLGPTCMQDPTNWGSVLYRGMGMGAFLPPESDTYSEDCLSLNVYAPSRRSKAQLPVLVWIHGGGFAIGGSSVPYQIPDQWVSRSQSHIIVTINYRLKIFGYPNAALGTENVGLLDQRMAIEWVRDNIGVFGGDTSRITLWGQSAGAFSVNYYAMAYPHDPIASAFITDSGGDYIGAVDNKHSNFSAVAWKVGCGGLDARKEFECVQKIDALRLVRVVNDMNATFVPQGDNRTAFLDPVARIRNGGVAKLPWIIGSNRDEAEISCWSNPGFQPRLDLGIPIYRYFYTGNFSNITPLPQLGAAHSAELPLVFGSHYQFNGNSTQFEYELSWTMQDLWLSFVSAPAKRPSTAHYEWPRLTAVEGDLAVFALNEKAVQTARTSQVLNCTK